MEDHDYAADVPASMDSYNIVVSLRTQANPTDEESEFVDALTSTQKTNIEALNVSL
jgi:hypothetical protein